MEFVIVMGGIIVGLIVFCAVLDARARRSGSRTKGAHDIWVEVRDSRRDARASEQFLHMDKDQSWTAWGKRNRLCR